MRRRGTFYTEPVSPLLIGQNFDINAKAQNGAAAGSLSSLSRKTLHIQSTNLKDSNAKRNHREINSVSLSSGVPACARVKTRPVPDSSSTPSIFSPTYEREGEKKRENAMRRCTILFARFHSAQDTRPREGARGSLACFKTQTNLRSFFAHVNTKPRYALSRTGTRGK